MTNTPLLILVMGVSGCGKSTVASDISQAFGFDMVEADDFHSKEAKERMASGQPLTDEMRLPWIKRLSSHLEQKKSEGKNAVLACSGLKRAHRLQFHATGYETHTIFLYASAEALHQRLANRESHFFPSSLLESQLVALEPPSADENLHTINVEQSRDTIRNEATNIISTLIRDKANA